MKKLTLFIILATSLGLKSQNNEDFKYMRSSLAMYLIPSSDFPSSDAVLKSWSNYPFPDKYNDHEVALPELQQYNSPTDPSLVLADLADENSYKKVLDQFIVDSKLANRLVGKWFGAENDEFSMDLIQERGIYNATDLDAAISKEQLRGSSALKDAGENLINNTFVSFTRLFFYSNEPIAAAVKETAMQDLMSSDQPQLAKDLGQKAIEAAYQKTKEGYTLFSRTWLYKLNWNEESANDFYTNYWGNKEAFYNSDVFSLSYLGSQSNSSLVTFSLTEKRSEEDYIRIALVRNVDNVFSKLQRLYDVFKPLSPITGLNPLTAPIGLKEGLAKGDKFDILELIQDPNTGEVTYKVIGSTKIDKKYIWDNRYTEDNKNQLNSSGLPMKGSEFKKNKKADLGMLIKLQK